MNQAITPEVDNILSPIPSRINFPEVALSSFTVLRRTYFLNSLDGNEPVRVHGALVTSLLEIAAAQVFVDESWYISTYPDVTEAIAAGKFENAKHHYIKFGYFEDRLPHSINVDEKYYGENNPDIKKAIKLGVVESCQVHFERFGFKEGRLPYDGWRLFENG